MWKEKFLYKIIDKCNRHLIKNGYFCIHISDYGKNYYVNDMLNYIKNNTCLIYVGKFYYIYKYNENNKISYSRPLFIRVFRKL